MTSVATESINGAPATALGRRSPRTLRRTSEQEFHTRERKHPIVDPAGSDLTPRLQGRVLSTVPELDEIREQWQTLHRRARGTAFGSFEWIRTWASIVNKEFALRVFTLWNDRGIAGILPTFIQPIHIGIKPVRRLRMAGEFGVYGEYAPLVDPAYRSEFASAAAGFIADLIARGDADYCDFSTFRADDPTMLDLTNRLRDRGLQVEFNPQVMPRVSVRLAETWEGYLASLRPSQRRELRRDLRFVGTDGLSFEVVNDVARGAGLLDQLIALHTALWKRRGAGGHFRTDRHFEAFLRTVTPIMLRNGSATFYVLSHGGRPITILLDFHTHDIQYGYIGGRDLDHPMSHMSPGRTLNGLAIKHAIERGCKEFDLMGGDQQYKLSLGGTVSYYGRLVARKAGAAGLPALVAHRLLELRHEVQIKFIRHRVLPKLNKTFRRQAKAKADHA